MLLYAGILSAQEVMGKITDADSSNTPLFQADVTQLQEGKVIATYKTYFNGTYRLRVKPNETYQLKMHFGGRQDTTVTIITDKRGTVISGTLSVVLHKDGLRLMGYIIDRDQDIPIQEAGIILRNVMTRKEEKYFTDVNGYYNLRMDFETNYSFKIDKRSPGIINRYQDTSFNISTIGFNQPLDFRLDIKLGPATTTIVQRQDYDPHAPPANKNLKPVVQVLGAKDSAKIREQAVALASVSQQLHAKDSIIATISQRIDSIQKVNQNPTVVTTQPTHKKLVDIDSREKLVEEYKRKQQADDLKKMQQARAETDLLEKKRQEKELQEKLELETRNSTARKEAQLKDDQQRAEQERKEKGDADRIQLAKDLQAMKAARAEKEAAEKAIAEKEAKREQALAEQERVAKADQEKLAKEAEEKRLLLDRLAKERLAKEKDQQNATAIAAAEKLKKQETALKAEILIKEKEKADKELADRLLLQQKAQEAKTITERERQQHELYEKAKLENAQIERDRQQAELIALKRARELNLKAERAKTDTVAIAKMTQLQRDLRAMKQAREEAEAKVKAEMEEEQLKEHQTKKESKRIAKEMAEIAKLRKAQEAEVKYSIKDQQRIASSLAQAEAERKDLEAKKALEEQEKSNLMQQKERLQRSEQVRVVNNSDTKEPENNSERNTIRYWERKLKYPSGDSAMVINGYGAKGAKEVSVKGIVRNGQTEDALYRVSVNIRRLNSIVSQEVFTDEMGAYNFKIDSGYFYLVSYYKDKFEISKQILDLTAYHKDNYTMLIQYLKEVDDFDPNAKMPIIAFEKNGAKLPAGLWGDLESIIKMMKEIPELKVKLYGLGSIDEDYPMELSVSRARTVANLFFEAGIKPARVRINGVGAFRPRSGCIEGKDCTEEQYRHDRVVLYKVVKE